MCMAIHIVTDGLQKLDAIVRLVVESLQTRFYSRVGDDAVVLS